VSNRVIRKLERIKIKPDEVNERKRNKERLLASVKKITKMLECKIKKIEVNIIIPRIFYLSISPKTISWVPIIVTTSATM
jgi:hypothetical protein